MRFSRSRLAPPAAALILVWLAAVLLAPAAATAAPPPTLYVASSGSNAANGCESQVSPCQTIQYAVEQAEPEARIEVASGTYHEAQIVSQIPLTLRGAGAGQTIVDGSAADNLASNGLLVFHPSLPGEIEVRGFTLEGARATAAVSEPTPVLLQLTAVPAGSQVTVAENEFLANVALDPDLPEDFSVGIFGYGSAADLAIEGNRFEGMWQGVLLEHSTGATTLAGNEFANLIATTVGANAYPAEGVYLLADGVSGEERAMPSPARSWSPAMPSTTTLARRSACRRATRASIQPPPTRSATSRSPATGSPSPAPPTHPTAAGPSPGSS